MTDPFEIQNLARSMNEIRIRTAIGRERKHGYRIALESEESSGGFFTFNRGTLYPVLHHLEKEGLIDESWELDLHESTRSRIVLELAADLEALYAHDRTLGLSEEEVERRAEEKVLALPVALHHSMNGVVT